MSISCCRCGAQTENAKNFHALRRSFSSRKNYYCPLCWAKRHRRINQVQPLLWLVVSIVSAFVVFWAPKQLEIILPAWIVLNMALTYFLLLLQLWPHELGHAVVARLLGWRVFKIILGQGKKLGQFRCAGFLFEINAIPTAGITLAASPQARFYRLKRFLFILAGPLTNAVLIVAVLLLVPTPQLFRPLPGTFLFVWIALLGSGFTLLVGNLLPYRVAVGMGTVLTRVESDGLALCTVFFLSDAAIRERQAVYYLLEGMESFQKRDYQAAKKWNERGLELFPDDIQNRFYRAFVLLFMGELHAAREEWQLLLKRDDLPAPVRALVTNNLAWTDLMIGGDELVREADQLSEEALREIPWSPPVKGTRGSVLIELGQAEKGLPLVRAAFDANVDVRLKALNACYLALGEWQLGHFAESQHQRELAQKLDPQCMLLSKVDQALAASSSRLQ